MVLLIFKFINTNFTNNLVSIFFYCHHCFAGYVNFLEKILNGLNNQTSINSRFIIVLCKYFVFYSISVISLAKALTLAFIAPLVVTILSPIMLNEKVGLRRWIAVLTGFIGSLIVLRPGFVEVNLASVAALGTGFLYGIYLIVTRKLHNSDHPLLTLLLTGVVGALIGSILVPTVWVQPTLNEWYIMFAIGFFASIGHLSSNLILMYADASKLAPFAILK